MPVLGTHPDLTKFTGKGVTRRIIGHGEERQIQLSAPLDVLLKSGWMSCLYFMELETVNPVMDYGHPKFIIKDKNNNFARELE